MYRKIQYFEQQGWNDKARELKQLTGHGYLSTFEAFDHHITAQLHGFDSGKAYYRQCSSRFFLPFIDRPTLIIHSRDDPFMTPDSAPSSAELPANVSMILTERGGHVGFVGGSPGRLEYWLEERIPCFLLDSEPEPQSFDK